MAPGPPPQRRREMVPSSSLSQSQKDIPLNLVARRTSPSDDEPSRHPLLQSDGGWPPWNKTLKRHLPGGVFVVITSSPFHCSKKVAIFAGLAVVVVAIMDSASDMAS
uniref:Uncharacterized protein n=1 Tax=Oryza meridionalis TaxID=40149 RepID=A0A0E0F373_9ORYZ